MFATAGNKNKALLNGRVGMPFEPAWSSLSDPDGEDNSKQVEWKVEVRPDGDLITREVWCDGKPWNQCGHEWEPQPVVWPTWPARSQGEVAASGSPLAGVQEYWSTVGNRLRDSAKWMAAVLGLAVATVIGTSPLAGMREHRPPPIAVFLGSSGLIFLGITMFLVLQVMGRGQCRTPMCSTPRHGGAGFRKDRSTSGGGPSNHSGTCICRAG